MSSDAEIRLNGPLELAFDDQQDPEFGNLFLSRPARYDPAWRHIGLGKRNNGIDLRPSRENSLRSFGHGRQWMMIGLGR